MAHNNRTMPVEQVYSWCEARESIARGIPCFFRQTELGFGQDWYDSREGKWDVERIRRDTGRISRANQPRRKQRTIKATNSALGSQKEDETKTKIEPKEDAKDTTSQLTESRRRSVRASTSASTMRSDFLVEALTKPAIKSLSETLVRPASRSRRQQPAVTTEAGVGAIANAEEAEKKQDRKPDSSIAQGIQRKKSRRSKKFEFEEGDENDPSIIIAPTCSASDQDEQRNVQLDDFFCNDNSRTTDECWNFYQDERARVHLRSADLYPLEAGDLLSFWDEQCDKTSSHQFICAAAAPIMANKESQLVCPGDGAVLKRRFPCGVTAFLRLFPGEDVDGELNVTAISSKDYEMLCRDWRGSETTAVWTSLPFAPFILAYELTLSKDQVLILPEGFACAIRSSDPVRRCFYYTRFAVFPDLGGANFILNIFDESSSFSQKVVLWNAAHRISEWLEAVAKQKSRCTPEGKARLSRLRDMVINVRQCVAHLGATIIPPDPEWDWKTLVADLDLTIALAASC